MTLGRWRCLRLTLAPHLPRDAADLGERRVLALQTVHVLQLLLLATRRLIWVKRPLFAYKAVPTPAPSKYEYSYHHFPRARNARRRRS